MKKIKATKHAKERLCQRVNLPVSIKEILNGIKNEEIKPITKKSLTRTLYYGMINNCPVKLIFSKSSNKVITVLPFNYDYCFNYSTIHNGDIYNITIFPDCYIETNNPLLLTKFEKFCSKNNCYIPCKRSIKNNFNEIFSIAWEKYNHYRKDRFHNEIQTYQKTIRCYTNLS